ncbi:Alpha/beta hydrolase fold protein [Alloalcanivorax dieselolei B5]|uniref:Alpha/beta hydrolase fold protein n=1 Tax=Alcanivorax dieselolei (strain DSM 16502 / CGMCC 1.3690 / MCCC 1A00001 / B-5) TaxID=930169 RepID=K0CIS5_ALCDB|nr:alpha/beta hydrolase [Alloalcanivorax dieselolei]AFT71627.1 Alpha/beta hydrolase fold protein [Alloalcanivorax dieselolei B5]GGJ89301.1 hydrolase [Alloalcanivorax dieselolei]
MHSLFVEETWINASQGRLFVKRWIPKNITGPAPIILFHDSLGCVALWRDFPQQLASATGREVIAYDRLGFGQSDPHPGTLGPDFVRQEAQDTFPELCQALQRESAVVFGHSVGGGMATFCAAVFADRCQALITESAQTFVEDVTLAGIRDADRGFAEKEQMDRLRKYHGDKAQWVLSAWVDTWLSEPFQDWTLSDTLPRVRCPVLAIHGDQDEYGSLIHPERITSLCAGPATKKIVPDCGHVPHKEKPADVLDAITAFFQKKLNG